MNASSRPTPPSPEQRLTDLEILFTHLEQRTHDLNDVVLQAVNRIDLLERQLRSMADRHSELEGRLQEPRDPAAEKPPHY
jgi:uncharacterized coiled-coil protein SlyX